MIAAATHATSRPSPSTSTSPGTWGSGTTPRTATGSSYSRSRRGKSGRKLHDLPVPFRYPLTITVLHHQHARQVRARLQTLRKGDGMKLADNIHRLTREHLTTDKDGNLRTVPAM